MGKAFDRLNNVELSCRAQLGAMAAQTALDLPAQAVLDKTAHLYHTGARRPDGVLAWPEMLRLQRAELGHSALQLTQMILPRQKGSAGHGHQGVVKDRYRPRPAGRGAADFVRKTADVKA